MKPTWSEELEAARQRAIAEFQDFKRSIGGDLQAGFASFESIADRFDSLIEALENAPRTVRYTLREKYRFEDEIARLKFMALAARHEVYKPEKRRGRRRDILIDYLIAQLYVAHEDTTGKAPTISVSDYTGENSEFVEFVNCTLMELGYWRKPRSAKAISDIRKFIHERPSI